MNDTFADVLAINQIIVPIRSDFISDLLNTKKNIHSICFEVYYVIKPF